MEIVEYNPEMGESTYPEGFEDVIKGLPIEEQAKFFRTTQRSSFSKTNWSERMTQYTKALDEDRDVQAIVVRDGYIVGAMITEWYSHKPVPVMPDKCVCTYYASDNDGAGYNEREDYTYFVCVPKSKG